MSINTHLILEAPPFEDGEAKIDSLWVNKQILGEVNPPHSHDGLMSFVIYLDNPLDREECINNRFDNVEKQSPQDI